jgi:hypothetical protein
LEFGNATFPDPASAAFSTLPTSPMPSIKSFLPWSQRTTIPDFRKPQGFTPAETKGRNRNAQIHC